MQQPGNNFGQRNASGPMPAQSPVPANNARFAGPIGVNAMPPATARGAFSAADRSRADASAAARARGGAPVAPAGRGAMFNRGGFSAQNTMGPASGQTRRFGAGGAIPATTVVGGRVVPARGAQSSQSAAFEARAAVVPAIAGRPSTVADQPVAIGSKRTFTEWRIKGIEMPGVKWSWTIFDDVEPAGTAEPDESAAIVEDAAASEAGTDAAEASKRRSPSPAKAAPKRAVQLAKMRINFAAVAHQAPTHAPAAPKALLLADKAAAAKTQQEKKEKAAVKSEDASAADADATEAEQAQVSASATVASSSNGDTPNGAAAAGDEAQEWTPFSKGPPQLGGNRLTLTYAEGRRRIGIEADVIRLVRVFRAEGRVEIVLDVHTAPGKRIDSGKKKGQEWVIAKGVVLETRAAADGSGFSVISRAQLEHAWANETVGDAQVDKKPTPAPAAAASASADLDVAAAAAQGDAEQGADIKMEETDDKEAVNTDAAAEAGAAAADATVAKEEAGDETPAGIYGNFAELPPLYRLLPEHDGPDEDEEYDAQGASELVIHVAIDKLANGAEDKWLKTGDVSEWLSALPAFSARLSEQIWQGKIEVVDPDPPPTMRDLCEEWAAKSGTGVPRDRRRFAQEQLEGTQGLIEMLARAVRPDAAISVKPSELVGPLAEASQLTHFTTNHAHLPLAVFALWSMITEYAGLDAADALNKRLNDILMSMPQPVIFAAMEGLVSASDLSLACSR
jgi:hypothetical protein